MDKAFLDLYSTRVLCPFCGEWHSSNSGFKALRDLDRIPGLDGYIRCRFDRGDRYDFCFYDGQFYFYFNSICIGEQKGSLPISYFCVDEDRDGPIVTIDITASGINTDVMKSPKLNGLYGCAKCSARFLHCNFGALACEAYNNKPLIIKLGFGFNKDEYQKVASKNKETSTFIGTTRNNNRDK